MVLRRLHGTLAAAAERGPRDFAELLLTPGVGARTVAALAASRGAPWRARRFTRSRALLARPGRQGRQPFPVPLKVYDETLRVMREAVDAARLGNDERLAALRELDRQARRLEAVATGPSFESSSRPGGRTSGELLPTDAPPRRFRDAPARAGRGRQGSS